jgi:hypothetical protein
MPGRGGLTHGRSSAGVLGHLVFVIRIFRIRHSVIRSDANPGVLLVLETEFLQKRKKVYLRTKIKLGCIG